MKAEETLQFMMDFQGDSFYSRQKCLDQLFCTIGNGYSWVDGELVEGQARALLALDSKKRQLEIAKKAIEKKLTVRDVEKLVYGSEEYVRKPEKQQPKSVYYKNLENKLKDYFGYKVKLDYTKSHQKLIIEYDDKEGLENLLNKFNIDI